MVQGDIASVAMALQNFTLLETVDLSYNNLTGVLGGNDAWCLLANMSMRLLNLEFNEISGAVPACLLGPGMVASLIGFKGGELQGKHASFSVFLPHEGRV